MKKFEGVDLTEEKTQTLPTLSHLPHFSFTAALLVIYSRTMEPKCLDSSSLKVKTGIEI